MKSTLWIFALLFSSTIFAQGPLTESGTLLDPNEHQVRTIPHDSPYDEELMAARMPLPYDHIREADVLWEKRIWRLIDSRELMNKSFSYPDRPLINIFLEAAERGDITLYNPIDDKFTTPMTYSQLEERISTRDTVPIYSPDTDEMTYKIVTNDLNPDDIIRWRVKEVWLFDEETSTMVVRILGIAPLIQELDDFGNLKYEVPLFWAYYPHCRQILAREKSFVPGNDKSLFSWEDRFESRYFASLIVKESNVYDRRIQDYKSGVDRIHESERIKNELFNREQDSWTH
ncbi:MAG: gliding motility protein GldN [Bacteroidota bacterium]